jgi:hypothetical protein
MVVTVVVEFP